MNVWKGLIGGVLCLTSIGLFTTDYWFFSAPTGFIGGFLLPDPVTRFSGFALFLAGIWMLLNHSSPLGIVFLPLGLFSLNTDAAGPGGGYGVSPGGGGWGDSGWGGGDGGGGGGGDGGGSC